jgi:hypothetical protein
MPRSEAAHDGLALVLHRFPPQAPAVRRLALQDPEFRGLCEDYALAAASLAGFEARADAPERPEVAEYRTVLAELEAEILRFVLTARNDADGEDHDR